MKSRDPRPSPRPAFLTADKRLQVYFYTSNTDKYLQARIFLEKFGLMVRHFRDTTPYFEEYTGSKQDLLERAVTEVIQSNGHASLVFLEDTSLRLEAFSTEDRDEPGLQVKEWFRDTTFEEVDSQLRESGNDRRAIVKSLIALHLPGLDRAVLFHGETSGVVASTPPSFEPDPQYPWLTPRTFNGWFIPDGTSKRLGEMSLDESLYYDFRIRAFTALVDRLEEYAASLNLPIHAYTRRRSAAKDKTEPLFIVPTIPTLVVIGRTCAGKTTFGEIAMQAHSLRHVEASGVLRTVGGSSKPPAVDAFELASRTLADYGADAVALKVLELYEDDLESGLIITGFRTVEELLTLREKQPKVKVVYVQASERIRFERFLKRARSGRPMTLGEFRKLDERQSSFGLLDVADDIAKIGIVNEGSIQDYMVQVDAVINERRNVPGVSWDMHPRHDLSKNQLYRCLDILDEAGRPLTTDEIERITVKAGSKIRHNNANKVLRRVPFLAKRFDLGGSRVRYEITNSGRAYIRLARSRSQDQHDHG